MKNTTVWIVAIFFSLSILGCSSPHTVTLTNGNVIETKTKPKFDKHEEFYKFKNASGKKVSLNRDEVRKIETK